MNLKKDDSVELEKSVKPHSLFSRSHVSLLITTSIMVVLITFGAFAGFVPRWRQHAALSAETSELSVPVVSVVFPKPGQPASSLALPAEVKPWVEAPIYARANGYLKCRLVDIGTHVETGQLLAEIDTPELNQELDRARAQLAQAEATLGLARITAARWADLLKTASVSEQEHAEKQADLKLKSATVESARAEVRRLERLKSFSRVTAPFAGTITVRNIDSGDLITGGGGKELFHLAQTMKLRVFVQVPQAMARSIAFGQPAQMTIPELPGRTFTGKVVRTAGVISADSRTLLVELEADNSNSEIIAGSYAQVSFTDAKRDAALMLPANSVLFRAEGPQVCVVQPDGKVEVRNVKLGRDFGQSIEILAGVNTKNRVILNPTESLVSGSMVTIAESNKQEKGQ
jgi:RND family efflux transporter MFP subunit